MSAAPPIPHCRYDVHLWWSRPLNRRQLRRLLRVAASYDFSMAGGEPGRDLSQHAQLGLEVDARSLKTRWRCPVRGPLELIADVEACGAKDVRGFIVPAGSGWPWVDPWVGPDEPPLGDACSSWSRAACVDADGIEIGEWRGAVWIDWRDGTPLGGDPTDRRPPDQTWFLGPAFQRGLP